MQRVPCNDRKVGAGLERGRNEVVAVEGIALDGEKGLACFDRAAVDRNAGDRVRQRSGTLGAGCLYDRLGGP